jgi:predicted permease
MRPDEDEIDEEIRGHLAIAIQQRIEQGEDPEAARLAALREFGYVPRMRDDMRRVWYSRWFDVAEALVQDLRVGMRSLWRAKGMAATVVVTLALGIGANAAIFSVVRGVLLRPLVNRGEERLIYIGQSAGPDLGSSSTTFSVPEIKDIRSRATTIEHFGEFSTVEFNLSGLGDPRVVDSGVVDGHYFEVMGLRPVLGRLIEPGDDGLKAAGVAVLTHRFWTTSLNSDPSVLGRTIRLGNIPATVIGVLEPSIPYPADTEIIANIVTSPHHLGAQMITMRTHRMTQLFARLKPGETLESAGAELSAIHAAMMREHPESYPERADMRISVTSLRDQIAAPARPILLVLLASAAIVFVIACSNVANLILARSVRREGELAVRAALGASRGALRRTLLAESLVLCGAGAILAVLFARPMMWLVARFAARFSVRALEVTVDPAILWVGGTLAMIAAVSLAYVPKLPSAHAPGGNGLAAGGLRITPGINRRLRVFATTQIAFSFVLLAGAATLLAALIALQTAHTGYDMRQVLAIDLPMQTLGVGTKEDIAFYDEVTRRIEQLSGVDGVSMGSFVPWRDAGKFGGRAGISFLAEGYTLADGEEHPRARLRVVAPNFFRVIGVPLLAGRDFSSEDRRDAEPVVIVSRQLAQRLFPNGDALNRKMWWTDPFFGSKPYPRRIVGVVGDVDDESIQRTPARGPHDADFASWGGVMAVYHPLQQMGVGGRLFVHTTGDPYALVQPVTRVVRSLAPDQPVERAATLEDVRAEVLAPERLNAFVFSGFAGVALLIAVVGVAGVLAFGVSARTREFGVRLAIGSTPYQLLIRVLSEGATIVSIGIIAGTAFGYAFAGLASSYFGPLQMPGPATLLAAAAVLVVAAIGASMWPAARASRVDVLQALRTE